MNISQKLRLGKMHGFGTMFWKNGSSLLASSEKPSIMSLCLETPETERRLARSNIQGAEIYTGEWVVSWRICWGFHLTFKQPQGGKKSVENWKIFDQLFWKWPFDSWVGGHFNPQISNFVALCTWQQMVNLWYAWYANIIDIRKGGAMNGGSLRLLYFMIRNGTLRADLAEENCPHGLKLRK